ncbi:MAG TPA: hypothetical protein VFH40_14565 [Gemmatimonadales bacterium]|jgi:hypothetical protein|nr:hypothetical protein [Gemmatimonadales bacterium]
MDRFRPWPRVLGLTALLLLGVGGCGFDPEGDQPLDPPAHFREWFAKTEACSGRTGNFDRIRWSVVEGASFACASGQCAGHWSTNHHIFLASKWVDNEMVVRHEMLHDLLGRPGHPDPPFGIGCPLTWETWHGGASQLDVVSLEPKDID